MLRLAGSAVLLAAFITIERRQRHALTPFSIFRLRTLRGADIGLSELINGRGAPTPSIGLQQLIPPHGSITGRTTFVAPGWSRELLNVRPADLNLYRLNYDDHYTGQIRLWK